MTASKQSKKPKKDFVDMWIDTIRKMGEQKSASSHSGRPVPELPENYWHCPFRKGCEVGESYCDWPCDKWATWHDDNIRKDEREQVLDAMREEILLCRYNISYPEIQDESADHLLKKLESIRGGEQE